MVFGTGNNDKIHKITLKQMGVDGPHMFYSEGKLYTKYPGINSGVKPLDIPLAGLVGSIDQGEFEKLEAALTQTEKRAEEFLALKAAMGQKSTE